MMIFAVIASTILLALVLLCARRGDYKQATAVAVVFTCLSLACIVHPVVAANSFVIALLALVFTFRHWKVRRFVVSSLCLTGLVYSLFILHDAPRLLEAKRLRAEYPIESLANRLAYETQRKSAERAGGLKSARPVVIAGGDRMPSDLDLLESDLYEDKYGPGPASSHYYSAPHIRHSTLAQVHSSFVEQFVDSPGFGFGRMIRPQTDRRLIPLPASPAIRLPPRQYEDPSKAEAADPAPVPRVVNASDNRFASSVRDFHRESYFNFVNATGFGYVVDRNHVAGFQSHQFRQLPSFSPPEESRSWKLEALDLLSLLKHPEPVAYVSDDLPRMEELRHAPVRPLDAFESKALAALRRGEDLEVSSGPERIRMLGSVRAAQQCIRCHDVDRGELLGAFSYRLRSVIAPAATAAERTK